MKVTKCTTKDMQAVGDFYDSAVLRLTQNVNYPKWRYKFYPSLATVKDATAQGTQYVCWDGDQVVGAFVLNTDPQGNYAAAKWGKEVKEGDYLVIHSFASHPDRLHSGIGEFMFNFCLEEARRQGKQAIRLDVVPTNTPAAKFYQKHGFTFVAEADLDRDFDDIPTFCLYELNLD